MNLKLIYNLMFGVFSLKKENMRFPNIRRMLVVVVFIPFFLTLLIINKSFLLLDYILFPIFIKQKIKNPIFIVAAPRSGTTFLHHSLAKLDTYFTCFKLWEIAFAPSIIQKYMWVAAIKLDQFIGSPLKKVAIFIENILLGSLKATHPISIDAPEEDEGVLLWDLSSIYLNFFYPDSHFFDDYLLFDSNLPEKRRMQIMKSYKNYIKRHNFVFNRHNKKHFISKNPLMMCKLKSLNTTFPDARILTINRNPASVLPSTLGLNNQLYSFFTSIKSSVDVNKRTTRTILDWYRMAHNTLTQNDKDNYLEIDFDDLISRDEHLQKRIAHFVNIPVEKFLLLEEHENTNYKSKNKYNKLTNAELNEIYTELPFLKKYNQ